jgi:Spy/CpxP family protein refolding chaperone
MKKILIVIGLALASVSTFTFAAENDRPRGGGDRMAQMQERLGLSDEQVTQLRQIRENGGSREEAHAVFTAEQRAMMKEHQAQRGNKGHRGKGKGKHKGKGNKHGNQAEAAEETPDDDTGGS